MASKTLTDKDPFPFGKTHKGKAMANVPDSYLFWLHENGSIGIRTSFPEVFEYIKDNLDSILPK